MSVAVLFCLKCGSHLVDVQHWRDDNTSAVRCSECESVYQMKGFTIGRLFRDREDEYKMVADAIRDIAELQHHGDELRVLRAAVDRMKEKLHQGTTE